MLYKHFGKTIKYFQLTHDFQKRCVELIRGELEGNGRKINNHKDPLGANDPLKVESKDKMKHLMKTLQLFSEGRQSLPQGPPLELNYITNQIYSDFPSPICTRNRSNREFKQRKTVWQF